MRNIVRTPKGSTVSNGSINSIKLSAKHAHSIERLAKQLGRSPDFITRKLIDNAIRLTDSLMACGCDPLNPALVDDYDCTAKMDALSPGQIAKLSQEGEYAQQTIRRRDYQRRGYIWID